VPARIAVRQLFVIRPTVALASLRTFRGNQFRRRERLIIQTSAAARPLTITTPAGEKGDGITGIGGGVGDGVTVGVFVGVTVRVGVNVWVFVGVFVGVAVNVFVGVDVLVGVLVGVWVGVSVGVFVGVFVGVAVGVSVGVGVRVGVFVGVGGGGGGALGFWPSAVITLLEEQPGLLTPSVSIPNPAAPTENPVLARFPS